MLGLAIGCEGGREPAVPGQTSTASAQAPVATLPRTACDAAGGASTSSRSCSTAPVAAKNATARPFISARHRQDIMGIAFSASDRYVATVGDETLRVWSTRDGQGLRTIRSVTPLHGVEFRGDDRVIAAMSFPDPVEFDLGTGAVVAKLANPGMPGHAMPAPAGSDATWMVASGRKLHIADAAGTLLRTLEAPKPTDKLEWRRRDILVSSDGSTFVALASFASMSFFPTSGVGAKATLRFPKLERISEFAVSPNGDAVAVSSRVGVSRVFLASRADGTASTPDPLPWHAGEGRKLKDGSNDGGGPYVDQLALSKTLVVAATSSGGYGWDRAARKPLWKVPGLEEPGHKKEDATFSEVAISHDERTVAFGTRTGRVFLVDARSGRVRAELGSRARLAADASVLDDGSLFIASVDASERVTHVSRWSLSEARRVSAGPIDFAEALSFDGSTVRGLLIDARADCDKVLARRATEIVPGSPPVDRGKAACVPSEHGESWDPWLGKSVLSRTGERALVPKGINPHAVLDTNSGAMKPLAGSEIPDNILQNATISDDGSVVVGHGTTEAFVWSAKTGALTARFKTEISAGARPAISRDGKRFALVHRALGGPAIVEEYATAGGKSIQRTPIVGGVVTAIAYGAGEDLAIAGTGSARGSVLLARAGQIIASSTDDANFPLSVRVSPDGKLAAAVCGDGAVRLFQLQSGKLLGTFLELDDDEWLVSTPKGAYSGTAEAATRLGWVFDAPAEHFSFERFSKTFGVKDIVRRRLSGEDVDVDTPHRRPPSVAFSRLPAASSKNASVSLAVTASSSGSVDVVRAYVEGQPMGEKPVCGASGEASFDVPLRSGVNHVSFVAFDAEGLASNEVSVDIEGPAAEKKGELYVLAIGVGAYPKMPASMQLAAAAGDADAIGAAFAGPLGASWSKTNVMTLTDAAASRQAILAGLEKLAAMRPEDVAIVSLSGHGFKAGESGDMLFATAGVAVDGAGALDGATIPEAIGWREIGCALSSVKGRVLVLLDACHAGDVSQETIVPNEALAGSLVRDQRAGVIIFAASKGRQQSYEPGNAKGIARFTLERKRPNAPSTDRGFFTQALLDAWSDPKTDLNADGWMQTSEIVDDVTRRVGLATEGLQTPWIARRELFGDFSLVAARPAP